MVSAMDWKPYSKASVCWGEGERQPFVRPQSHPPAPALALAQEPAAETKDAGRGETVARAELIGTAGFRTGDMAHPRPGCHQGITRQYFSHQSLIAMAS